MSSIKHADTVQFIYAWCGHNKIAQPVYTVTFENSGQFKCVVSVGSGDNKFWGEGYGCTPKIARLFAAERASLILVESGLMNKEEFETMTVKKECATTKPYIYSLKPYNNATNQSRYNNYNSGSFYFYGAWQDRKLPENIKYVTDVSFDTDLWSYYENQKELSVQKEQKLKLIDEIYSYLLFQFYDDVQLFLVGSTATNLASFESDLNLTMVIDLDSNINVEQEHEVVLRKLLLIFKEFLSDRCETIEIIQSRRKIHVLKMHNFKAWGSQFSVTVSVNDLVAIRNTHLLASYANMDPRFCALTVVVKQWAAKESLISYKNDGLLSGYSISLLVLHFLQCATSPKVMPILQKVAPNCFHPSRPVEQLDIYKDSSSDTTKKLNEFPLAELLLQFFDYYKTVVDFSVDVISVRNASRFNTFAGTNIERCKGIFIEEPFDCSNVVDESSSSPENVLRVVQECFLKCFMRLKYSATFNSLGLK